MVYSMTREREVIASVLSLSDTTLALSTTKSESESEQVREQVGASTRAYANGAEAANRELFATLLLLVSLILTCDRQTALGDDTTAPSRWRNTLQS